MTFSIVVPNANQSPGVFPAQNNTNFQRLKDIQNADHNFTNSVALEQGIHKQCTMINRATPVGLPNGGNGVFYSKDTAGVSQLYWWNNVEEVQITPSTLTMKGSQNFGSGGGTALIFADPGYNYQATGFLAKLDTVFYLYKLFSLNGTIRIQSSIVSNNAIPPGLRLEYGAGSSKDLIIGASSSGTYKWTLIISRIP